MLLVYGGTPGASKIYNAELTKMVSPAFFLFVYNQTPQPTRLA